MPSTLIKKNTIEFDREKFIEAMAILSDVVPARSDKPLLQNIQIKTHPDPLIGVQLYGTDLDVSIRQAVEGVEADSEMSILVSPKKLSSILRGKSDQRVTMSVDEERIRIRGRGWKFDFLIVEGNAFPELDDFETVDFHSIDPGALRSMIRRTIFASDPGATKYALGGIYLQSEQAQITAVATDGRRLSTQVGQAEANGGGMPDLGPVIPQKALRIMERVLRNTSGPAQVALKVIKGPTGLLNASTFKLSTDMTTLTSRLVEGRFPPYKSIIPENIASEFTVTAQSLLEACQHVSNVTDGSAETRGVDFHYSQNALKLMAQSSDIGEAECEIELSKICGEDLVVSYDVRYLIEFLSVLDGKAVVRIGLTNTKNASLFTTEDGMSYVLMPLSRDEPNAPQ